MSRRHRQGLRRLDPEALRGLPRAADLRALRRRSRGPRSRPERRRACSRSPPAPASSRARLAARCRAATRDRRDRPEPPMLDRGRDVGTARPVQWRQADAMQLPFDDASFDAVVCQFGVMFFPDKAQGVRRGAPRARAGRRVRVQRLGSDRGQRIRRHRDDGARNAVSRRPAALPGAHAARLPRPRSDRARPRGGGFATPPQIDTVAARSRAPSPRIPAIAYCQGTPLRSEIEARDAAAARRSDRRRRRRDRRGASAPAPVDGKMQAHIVVVER